MKILFALMHLYATFVCKEFDIFAIYVYMHIIIYCIISLCTFLNLSSNFNSICLCKCVSVILGLERVSCFKTFFVVLVLMSAFMNRVFCLLSVYYELSSMFLFFC